MLAIKKVAVSQIDETSGAIIDSFSTLDDRHTNAPSINATEEYVSNACDTVEDYVDDKYNIHTEIVNVPFTIDLQKYSGSIYQTVRELNADVPIRYAKSGAYVRAYVEFDVITSETSTYTEIVDNKLILHISSSDVTALGTTNRIWMISSRFDETNILRKYNPWFPLASLQEPLYSWDGGIFLISWIGDNQLLMKCATASEGGSWYGAFEYMTDNSNY